MKGKKEQNEERRSRHKVKRKSNPKSREAALRSPRPIPSNIMKSSTKEIRKGKIGKDREEEGRKRFDCGQEDQKRSHYSWKI